ncbi:MAG: hypothetical protein H6905_03520 [Hyphomicrobiales bacterium]|nr:hypothetical protein [Hyphomicrobiales bacterium]
MTRPCSVLALGLGLLLALAPAGPQAQDHQHSDSTSPYTGFENRAIKSLSEADIAELRRGGGWGLALAAELNGVPGPVHVLDLKDELGLSSDQVAGVEAIDSEMRARAIAEGEHFLAAEMAIEQAFASDRLDEQRLRPLIDRSERSRANLRFIHLSRHLQTRSLLTDQQIERYNRLRGYGFDPCAHVPEGHDADLWRRHHGCD